MPEGASTDLTVGETYRNLIALRGDFNRMAAKLDDRPDWQDLKRVERGHDEKIAELQDTVKWGMRLIVTACTGFVINIIYTSAQGTGNA